VAKPLAKSVTLEGSLAVKPFFFFFFFFFTCKRGQFMPTVFEIEGLLETSFQLEVLLLMY
jgi:hypothetical protein